MSNAKGNQTEHPPPHSDASTVEDGLDYFDYRDALCGMIRDADTPLTVGVFGEWGSGKTSLMRMVRDKLDPPEQRGAGTGEVVTVWFEAWKFARERTWFGERF